MGAHERETKTCPDCAEEILAAARKCRYCGYRYPTDEPPSPAAAPLSPVAGNPLVFDPTQPKTVVTPAFLPPDAGQPPPDSPPPDRQKTRWVAVVLQLIFTGLGHLYARERGRAALLALAAVMFSATGLYADSQLNMTSTEETLLIVGGLAALGVWAFALWDVHSRAVPNYNRGGTPRAASPALIITACCAASLLAVTIPVAESQSGGDSELYQECLLDPDTTIEDCKRLRDGLTDSVPGFDQTNPNAPASRTEDSFDGTFEECLADPVTTLEQCEQLPDAR